MQLAGAGHQHCAAGAGLDHALLPAMNVPCRCSPAQPASALFGALPPAAGGYCAAVADDAAAHKVLQDQVGTQRPVGVLLLVRWGMQLRNWKHR